MPHKIDVNEKKIAFECVFTNDYDRTYHTSHQQPSLKELSNNIKINY